MNSYFGKMSQRRWIYQSPDTVTRNAIDFIIVDKFD